MSVHRLLDDALPALDRLLVRMAALVADQFTEAVDALSRSDAELARAVRRRDDEVDALELEVDRTCERVLALYQPVARDLRLLLVAVRVNNDFERIGDHAKAIAKAVPYVAAAPRALAATRLLEMADAVRLMLRDVHGALERRDPALAAHVIASDRDVNRLHQANLAALLEHARERPEDLAAVARLIATNKAMERAADHAKRTAKHVVYLLEGEDVRHRRLQKHARRATTSGDASASPPE
jgi:phosphate transport system protein